MAKLHVGGYSLQTRFGLTAVSWAFDPATKLLHTNVTVPVGSTAEVVHERVMPAVAATGAPASELYEVSEAAGRQVLLWGRGAAEDEQRTTTVVGSGQWAFASQYE